MQGCVTTGAGIGDKKKLALDQVANQVTIAIDLMRHTHYAKLAKLKSAEIDFQTVKNQNGELEIKPLGFLDIDFSISHQVTHTFSFIYSTPAHRQVVLKPREHEVTDQLVEMMSKAADAAGKSVYAGGLSLGEVDLTVEFAVEYDGTLGAEFPFKFVTLDANVSAKRDEIQTVKLTFVPKWK